MYILSMKIPCIIIITFVVILLVFLLDLILDLEQTSYTVSENAGTVTITVKIYGGIVDKTITLQFSTNFSTATSMFK